MNIKNNNNVKKYFLIGSILIGSCLTIGAKTVVVGGHSQVRGNYGLYSRMLEKQTTDFDRLMSVDFNRLVDERTISERKHNQIIGLLDEIKRVHTNFKDAFDEYYRYLNPRADVGFSFGIGVGKGHYRHGYYRHGRYYGNPYRRGYYRGYRYGPYRHYYRYPRYRYHRYHYPRYYRHRVVYPYYSDKTYSITHRLERLNDQFYSLRRRIMNILGNRLAKDLGM